MTASDAQPTRESSGRRDHFADAYAGPEPPAWDVPFAQPAILGLLDRAGVIGPRVLDAGCGTGEIAIALAARGRDVIGIDRVPAAIERARAKLAATALPAGLTAPRFRVGSVLDLTALLDEPVDTVVDAGVWHIFGDANRLAYTAQARAVLHPGGRFITIAFSEAEPPGWGPRRVTEAELRAAFSESAGWRIDEITATEYALTGNRAAAARRLIATRT
jgi:cyclopropane fatty-acyl-phospholipid synthase-like methyltransferase